MPDTYLATVYGQRNCMQCQATTRELHKRGVPFTYIDVTYNTAAVGVLKSLGYTQVPVVTVVLPDGTDHWFGFRLEKIQALAYLVGEGEAS